MLLVVFVREERADLIESNQISNRIDSTLSKGVCVVARKERSDQAHQRVSPQQNQKSETKSHPLPLLSLALSRSPSLLRISVLSQNSSFRC